MRLIPTSHLKLGSIAALDVIDANNVSVVKKGETVTQNIISTLNMFGISSVYIKDEYCFVDEKKRVNATANMGNLLHTVNALQGVANKIQEGNSGAEEFDKIRHIAGQFVVDFMAIKDDLRIVFEPAKMRSSAIIEQTTYVTMMSVGLGVKLGLTPQELGELCTICLTANFALVSPKFAEICPDPVEFKRIHTKLTHDYLKANYELPPTILEGILQYNEVFDGSGYPSGLKGEQVSKYTNISSIINFFYELKSNPANAAMGQQIFDIMFKNNIKKFEPNVRKVFLENIQYYSLDTIIRLENGDIGVVVDTNKDRPFRPVLRIVSSTLFPEGFILDLAIYEFKIGSILYYID